MGLGLLEGLLAHRVPPPAPVRAFREDFFESWSPEMAWVLGLIFGDGHVMNRTDIGQYGVSLAGTEQVCGAVATLLQLAQQPRRAKGVNCYVLQWYSRDMVRGLARYGLLGGSKATTMRLPEAPSAALPHLLRGLWDADGTWERRGLSLRARYTSASEGFVDDLQAHVGGSKCSWRSDAVKVGAVGYHLTLRVGETASLRDRIYADSTPETRCVRKHARAIERSTLPSD